MSSVVYLSLYIFEHCTYAELRQTHAQHVGQGNFNLQDSMQDVKRIKVLADFIVKTERFNNAG